MGVFSCLSCRVGLAYVDCRYIYCDLMAIT